MFTHRILLCLLAISYTTRSAEQQLIQAGSFQFYLYAIISTLLSCFAGICSGLTVGFMSISKQEMELMAHSGSQAQKKIAEPILGILINHHRLLTTLLLSNALALQALPIFLDKIVPGYMAVIISVIAVVIFGEVIPQAYCTGPQKVTIASYFVSFVRFLQCILYPFTIPMVYVLDNWLGHHDDKIVLTPENLKAILYLHNKTQYGYRPEEIQILQNTIDIKVIKVSTCMIKLKQVFMIERQSPIDKTMLGQLKKYNFSKIPVYQNNKWNVVGYLKVKKLLRVKLGKSQTLDSANLVTKIVQINENMNLLDAIDILRNKKINFAAVKSGKKCLGIITLKQIFQKMVLKEFRDNDARINFNWNKGQEQYTIAEAPEQN